MNKAQTAAILHIIKTAYPTFGGSASNEDIAALWTEMLVDATPDIVTPAVKKHIQTNRFPPTIADIRSIIADLTVPRVTAGEIWQEVYRLLNWDISPEDEAEAYAHMSDICREATLAVGGWYTLSMSPENDPFTRKNFLAAAEVRIRQDRERGVAFDWSKVNKLISCEAPRLLGGDSDG